MKNLVLIISSIILFTSFACKSGDGQDQNNIGNNTSTSSIASSKLSALTLGSVTLSPAFDPLVSTYTANAYLFTNSVTVSATAADAAASVSINAGTATTATASVGVGLVTGDNKISVKVTSADSSSSTTYEITITKLATANKTMIALPGSSASDNDNLGKLVDGYGDTVIASKPGEDYAGLTDAGSVVVYQKNASTGIWEVNTTLKSEDTSKFELYAYSLAIYKDTIAVGATFHDAVVGLVKTNSAGGVYVYKRTGSTWSLSQTIVAPTPTTLNMFGMSVDIYENTMIIGEPGKNASKGAVYIYEKGSDGKWNFVYNFDATNSSEQLGSSVKVNGNYAIAGAPGYSVSSPVYVNAGRIHMFHKNSVSGNWENGSLGTSPIMKDDDWFGTSVAITNTHVAASSPRYNAFGGGGSVYFGAVSVYERDLTDPTEFIWKSGNRTDLFPTSQTTENWFGTSIDMYNSMMVVGRTTGAGDSRGTVYSFRNSGANNWTLDSNYYSGVPETTHTDLFGTSVSLTSSYLVVGAPGYDIYSGGIVQKNNVGAIYIFE